MKDLKSTKELVQILLEKNPKTRNSDSYLYLCVLNVIAQKRNINLSKISVPQFLLNLSISPFPPFESVRRARQKLQRAFPHLSANAEVEVLRDEQEEAYLEFARS